MLMFSLLKKRLACSLAAAFLLGLPARAASEVQAKHWAVEAGSGFAYVYPHPQLRLWYRLPAPFELGLGWSPGINNYEVWAQTFLLQGKYRFELLPWLHPFAALDAGISVFAENQLQARPFVGIGLGTDWMALPEQGLGLTGSLHLLAPDPYSSAPFVFRPEFSLRWSF